MAGCQPTMENRHRRGEEAKAGARDDEGASSLNHVNPFFLTKRRWSSHRTTGRAASLGI